MRERIGSIFRGRRPLLKVRSLAQRVKNTLIKPQFFRERLNRFVSRGFTAFRGTLVSQRRDPKQSKYPRDKLRDKVQYKHSQQRQKQPSLSITRKKRALALLCTPATSIKTGSSSDSPEKKTELTPQSGSTESHGLCSDVLTALKKFVNGPSDLLNMAHMPTVDQVCHGLTEVAKCIFSFSPMKATMFGIFSYYILSRQWATSKFPIQKERFRKIIRAAIDNDSVYLRTPRFIINMNTQDAKGNTALHYAIVNGNFQAAKTLLTYNPDLLVTNNKGNTVFYLAASRGYIPVVEAIYKHVMLSELKKKEKLLRFKLVSESKIRNLRKSKKKTKEITEKIKNSFTKGVKREEFTKVANEANKKGWTPLCSAIAYGHPATALWLLDHAAKPNPTNKLGHTALFWAVKRNMVAVVKRLIEKSASLKTHGLDGGNILHVLAKSSTPLCNTDQNTTENSTLILDYLIDTSLKDSKSLKNLLYENSTEACNLDIELVYNAEVLRDWKKESKLRQVLFMRSENKRGWESYWKDGDDSYKGSNILIPEYKSNEGEKEELTAIQYISKKLGEYLESQKETSYSQKAIFCKIGILKKTGEAELFQDYKPIKFQKTSRYGRNPLHEACVYGNVVFVKRVLDLLKLRDEEDNPLIDSKYIIAETLTGRNCLELIKIYGGYGSSVRGRELNFETSDKYDKIAKLLEKSIHGRYNKNLGEEQNLLEKARLLAGLSMISKDNFYYEEEKKRNEQEFALVAADLISDQELIMDGRDLKKDSRGYTLLHYVTRYDDPEMMRVTIEAIKNTANIKAILEMTTSKEVIELVQQYGKDTTYGTPLFEACVFGAARVVGFMLGEFKNSLQSLIGNKASINIPNVIDIKNKWDKHKRKEHKDDTTKYNKCIECEDYDKQIKDKGGLYSATPLLGAAHSARRDTILVEILKAAKIELKSQANLNAYINQETHLNNSALKVLVNAFYRVKPDEEGRNNEQGHAYVLDMVKTLVEHGANVDIDFTSSDMEFSESPLHTAVRQNNLKLIEYLLLMGANANTHDKFHSTPLHYACLKGYWEAAVLLVRKGRASVFHVNQDGLTPYDLCVNNETLRSYIGEVMVSRSYANSYINRYKIFSNTIPSQSPSSSLSLLDTVVEEIKLACPTVYITSSEHALRAAAALKRKGILLIKRLLEAARKEGVNIDLNAQGPRSGRTALHYAAQYNNTAVVEYLLQMGADINVLDNENNAAVNYATIDEITVLFSNYNNQQTFL